MRQIVSEYMYRLDIVDHLLELHERGIQHGDFAEHNIVIDEDGKPFIVDFEHAETHECERTEDIIEGAIAPDKWDFGCYEIFDFCYDHRIWRTGTIYRCSVCRALFTILPRVPLLCRHRDTGRACDIRRGNCESRP